MFDIFKTADAERVHNLTKQALDNEYLIQEIEYQFRKDGKFSGNGMYQMIPVLQQMRAVGTEVFKYNNAREGMNMKLFKMAQERIVASRGALETIISNAKNEGMWDEPDLEKMDVMYRSWKERH